MFLFDILGWALFGLVIGAIARLLYPGPNPMGIFLTMILGIAGSLLGGFLGYALTGGDGEYQAAGWIMSVIGAVLVVWITAYMTGPRRIT
jgi:uncharacterized membrane protein YeaQ/YmgE (transglycosylase-associated protein family)